MPHAYLCCCKDNVDFSFFLGMGLVVLSLSSCFVGDTRHILSGIYGALVSGILIFGAKQRNPTAILVWMVFAIVGLIGLIVVSVLAIIALFGVSSDPSPDPDINVFVITADFLILLSCFGGDISHILDVIYEVLESEFLELGYNLLTFAVIFAILTGVFMLFQIWTILVAKRVRVEIQRGGTGYSPL